MLNKIQSLYETGFSSREIARKLNISSDEVNSTIKQNSFSLKKESFSEDKIEQILQLYFQGVGALNLGKKYSIDPRRVKKWAREHGILRSASEAKRHHTINEHIFDKIDSDEKSYWLGYLFADSSIMNNGTCIAVRLPHSKKSHLEKLVSFFGGDKAMIKTRDKTVEVHLSNNYLVNRLLTLGFGLKSEAKIDPNILTPAFLRGYFDGKSSLFKHKNQYNFIISGNKSTLDEIVSFFAGKDIQLIYNDKKPNILSTKGEIKIRKMLDIIYKSSSVHLEDRYQKYLELKSESDVKHPKMFESFGFKKNIKIDGKEMTTSFLKGLSLEERMAFVDVIVAHFLKVGFLYPDDDNLLTSYKYLVDYQVDLSVVNLSNMTKLGNNICRYFCHSFYKTTTEGNRTMYDAFSDEEVLRKAVINKMQNDRGSYNFSNMTIIDEIKDMRECGYVSIFKPQIAKYVCMKYSAEGDVVGDYSAGFGGRLLGAMACGRKYIGTDPLMAPELKEMISYFNFKDCDVIQSGSEHYRGAENSIDLYWSSPPYYDLERYSDSLSQAYNKGEYYFYNTYWRQTLENIKFMLKPGKYFGVNVSDKHIKMVEIAKEYFGDIVEEISLTSARHHFAGYQTKIEKIYMFKNKKPLAIKTRVLIS